MGGVQPDAGPVHERAGARGAGAVLQRSGEMQPGRQRPPGGRVAGLPPRHQRGEGAGAGRAAGPEDLHDHAAGLCEPAQHREHGAGGAQPGHAGKSAGGAGRGQGGDHPRGADCAERVGGGGVYGDRAGDGGGGLHD